MWPSVQAAFVPFSSKLEGYLPWMYLDILGWVTTGMGNKVDPMSQALSLPWRSSVDPSSPLVSQSAIAAAWQAVDAERTAPKGQQQGGLAAGPQYGAGFGGITTIRLAPDGITALIDRQLSANEADLRRYYPNWDSLVAAAQLGLLSMAWAMGTGWLDGKVVSAHEAHFPQLHAALTASPPDYATAAANCQMQGSGIATRNAADKALFLEAAAVQAQGSDPSVLWYPNPVPADAPPAAAPALIAGLDTGTVLGVVGVVGGGLLVGWEQIAGFVRRLFA